MSPYEQSHQQWRICIISDVFQSYASCFQLEWKKILGYNLKNLIPLLQVESYSIGKTLNMSN